MWIWLQSHFSNLALYLKVIRLHALFDFSLEKGTTEGEMAGWHHWRDGRESEWIPGDGDGQGGLAGCDSRGRKESDTTERLNWNDNAIQTRVHLMELHKN